LITAQQQTDFYALGGGLPNAGLTEAEVTQSRVDWEAAEAARQAEEAARQAEEAARQAHADWVNGYWTQHNATVAPVLDAGPVDDVALVAALRSLADSIEGA
jgi:type II secretory pathway pseudopilin PulG